MKPCDRFLDCGHSCTQLCCVTPCKSECGCDTGPNQIEVVDQSLQGIMSAGKRQTIGQSTHPQVSSRKDFHDYARGGYKDSDQNLAALAEKESTKDRQQRLDNESFNALFGNPGEPVLADRKDNLDLINMRPEGKGSGRGTWVGVIEVSKPRQQYQSNSDSLLDLL